MYLQQATAWTQYFAWEIIRKNAQFLKKFVQVTYLLLFGTLVYFLLYELSLIAPNLVSALAPSIFLQYLQTTEGLLE